MAIRVSEEPLRSGSTESEFPVLICLLGSFRLLKSGVPLLLRGGRKSEALLSHLALARGQAVPREMLLDRLWPDTDLELASQSLNSLVYHLRRTFESPTTGAAPVYFAQGGYGLNVDAGVGVDVWLFDALASSGDRHVRLGDPTSAQASYLQAVEMYRGDLCISDDVRSVIERERLRVLYLSLLAKLADQHFAGGDYGACLQVALRLLASEPTREDAHRLVMRCYVRRGERAQALRQYRLCEDVLRREFEARTEPATRALFDQIRQDPGSV